MYRSTGWTEIHCMSTTRTRWALFQGSQEVGVQFSAPDTVGPAGQSLPTSVRFSLFPGATIEAQVFAPDTAVLVTPVVVATWTPRGSK